ncbi:MAG: hypothetical protein CML24_09775 [Rhizobiales bacterium]|nr:hypothetical protein [Hyphomicrobiales bacterium]|tara:strand:+ start:7082 stop:7465 length:384 start_codon:yes stop_codon:yes gene_type:complete
MSAFDRIYKLNAEAKRLNSMIFALPDNLGQQNLELQNLIIEMKAALAEIKAIADANVSMAQEFIEIGHRRGINTAVAHADGKPSFYADFLIPYGSNHLIREMPDGSREEVSFVDGVEVFIRDLPPVL